MTTTCASCGTGTTKIIPETETCIPCWAEDAAVNGDYTVRGVLESAENYSDVTAHWSAWPAEQLDDPAPSWLLEQAYDAGVLS